MKANTPFRQAIEALHPGATGSQAAKLLDGKITRFDALNWMAGKCQPPRWVIETLAAKLEASAETPLTIARQLRALPDRPGFKAGAANLARYLANRNRT